MDCTNFSRLNSKVRLYIGVVPLPYKLPGGAGARLHVVYDARDTDSASKLIIFNRNRNARHRQKCHDSIFAICSPQIRETLFSLGRSHAQRVSVGAAGASWSPGVSVAGAVLTAESGRL